MRCRRSPDRADANTLRRALPRIVDVELGGRRAPCCWTAVVAERAKPAPVPGSWESGSR
jgi:hypothetical protein